MKLITFVLFALLSANASAGPYIDFGLGYIQTIPGQASGTLTVNGEVVASEQRTTNIDLNSPFFMFKGGYHWDTTDFYLEIEKFGIIDDKEQSISSLRVYQRFEADIGLYADFGVGRVLEAPSKNKSETERQGPLTVTLDQRATVNLSDTFLMYRIGYRWQSTNMHLELERIGDLLDTESSITTARIYKRWEWN